MIRDELFYQISNQFEMSLTASEASENANKVNKKWAEENVKIWTDEMYRSIKAASLKGKLEIRWNYKSLIKTENENGLRILLEILGKSLKDNEYTYTTPYTNGVAGFIYISWKKIVG